MRPSARTIAARKSKNWNPFALHYSHRSKSVGDLGSARPFPELQRARPLQIVTGKSSPQDPWFTRAHLAAEETTRDVEIQVSGGEATHPSTARVKRTVLRGSFRFIRHVEPVEPYTMSHLLRFIFFGSWVSILLPCVPAGIILHLTSGDSIATFVANLLATIPLGFISEVALDQIGLRVGPLLMRFLYICTSNFVQLVGSIILLRSRQVLLLKTSLIGGLLANILLILGLSIFAGGIGRRVQYYNTLTARTSSNLLSLAATSLLIPTASQLLGQIEPGDLPKQSRGAAFILIGVYACYLVFQFKSHVEAFGEKAQKVARAPLRKRVPLDISGLIRTTTAIATGPAGPFKDDQDVSVMETLPRHEIQDDDDDDDDDTEQFAYLPGWLALVTFLAASTLLAFCVDYTISSIDALSAGANLSPAFIGLILLPIPNCDLSPISHAIEDKLENTMDFTIGKCLQTALFITPLTVLIAWGMGVEEMTLVFDGFEIVSLFAAILLLNFLMDKGEVSWLQGCLLLGDWGLVAVSAYFTQQQTVSV